MVPPRPGMGDRCGSIVNRVMRPTRVSTAERLADEEVAFLVSGHGPVLGPGGPFTNELVSDKSGLDDIRSANSASVQDCSFHARSTERFLDRVA